MADGRYFGNKEGLDGEEADNDRDDECVNVVSEEGGFDTTNEGIKNDPDREQKGRGDNMHARSIPKPSAAYLHLAALLLKI
jgi:hypothetical protein